MLRSPVHSVSIRRWSRCGTACIRQRETADDGIACADHSTYGRRRCSILRKRGLLDSINTSTHAGLHDRALIGLMVYSFARIGAALGMVAWDVYTQTRRRSVRLHERAANATDAVPSQPRGVSTAYLDGAVLRDDPNGPLFRTIGRGTGKLTRTVLPQANA
jgi:hypothetical protein